MEKSTKKISVNFVSNQKGSDTKPADYYKCGLVTHVEVSSRFLRLCGLG